MPAVQAVIALFPYSTRDADCEWYSIPIPPALQALRALRRPSPRAGHQDGFPQLGPDGQLSRIIKARQWDGPQHRREHPPAFTG